jgi:hypothetical protein
MTSDMEAPVCQTCTHHAVEKTSDRYISQRKQVSVQVVSTDRNGHFDLGTVKAGKYRLLASPHRGFKQPSGLQCQNENVLSALPRVRRSSGSKLAKNVDRFSGGGQNCADWLNIKGPNFVLICMTRGTSFLVFTQWLSDDGMS